MVIYDAFINSQSRFSPPVFAVNNGSKIFGNPCDLIPGPESSKVIVTFLESEVIVIALSQYIQAYQLNLKLNFDSSE